MTADPSFQIKSMTAFGRGVSHFPYGRLTIDLQSVNRRHLEINVGLPRLLARFEMEMRKQISAFVGRGMITLSLSWKTEARQPVSVVPNLPLARALKEGWEKLAADLGFEKTLPLELLTHEKELFIYEEELADEEIFRKAVSDTLQEALDGLLAMKRKEGIGLAKDIESRLQHLHKAIAYIEANADGASEKYRQKLSKRLEELFSGNFENEERILREVAIYAERVDVTEEITRFKSHLGQFEEMLYKPLEEVAETRGKTLDFLLQELLREGNTIGSKASDLAVVQNVVTIKSELEKIREQVQNIE